jgi:hypothetical protein
MKGAAMTNVLAGEPAVPDMPLLVPAELLLRLHGVACIRCGSVGGPLLPAGHAYTITDDGGRLGWPVVACPEHQGKPCH